MNLSLFKLGNLNHLDINEDITISEDYYKNTEIRDIKNVHVEGRLSINYEDEIDANLVVTGTFILPCAVTLEDVAYDFETEIDQSIGKYDDFYAKNKNTLDILPVLWENIVSEVPIRVVKEGVSSEDLSGDGWEVISNE